MLESGSNDCVFHQLTQYHIMVRLKVCEERSGAYISAQTLYGRPPFTLTLTTSLPLLLIDSICNDGQCGKSLNSFLPY